MNNPITTPEQLRSLYGAARERSVLKELPHLDTHALRLIAMSPFVVFSTHGADGAADCSPRGGEAGFVKAVDSHKLLIADSPGNNRLDSLENIISTRHIGLLFLVPGIDETLRVNGTATLSIEATERQLCADMLTGARRVPKLVIKVQVQACYLHCAKALMRSQLWDASRHVQRSVLPSMGEMMRDQMADRVSPGTVFETQEQMLERYQQSL